MDGNEALVFKPKLPSLGWTGFIPVETGAAEPPFTYTGNTLKTPFYQIQFDDAGRITSLIDTYGPENRELVAPGGVFNGLISAQDVPVLWEAWDIDADWTRYLMEETRLLSTEAVAAGPVCLRIRRTYRIGEQSVLTQDSVFYAGERRIDFETKVDWQEKRRLLKAVFDTVINAAQVRCEVQYGHLLRNTHKNLPGDRAKFEICAHKWICVEEEGGGIALLNDSKYGHDVDGGRMRLTLLRSPTAPDETADRGEQRFTYSLLPFSGSFGDSGLVRAGYELNDPAVAEVSEKAGAAVAGTNVEYSLFSIDGKGIIAESIKAPEAGTADSFVIRLYESLGGREHAVLHFTEELASASATDMLESNPEALPVSGKDLALDFRAFEIKTILVTFR
jgi:alpha-mannosidase